MKEFKDYIIVHNFHKIYFGMFVRYYIDLEVANEIDLTYPEFTTIESAIRYVNLERTGNKHLTVSVYYSKMNSKNTIKQLKKEIPYAKFYKLFDTGNIFNLPFFQWFHALFD